MKNLAALMMALLFAFGLGVSAKDWVVYEGPQGPGKGKHIVLLAGDEEYRSEEGLPMLAKILAVRHGFKCTVLFSLNPNDGTIDPNNQNNIPGIEALDTADLCVMLWRFRQLPDEKMKHFVDYLHSGKPIIALRTSTHAFDYGKNKQSQFAKYDWQSTEWPGGFGKQVLGETWVAHHGEHKKEATRGVVEPAARKHPILKSVQEIFGDTDVYTATPPPDAEIIVRGQVLAGMNRMDSPVEGKKNQPMQPVVWTRQYKNESGTTNRILTTTMGSSTDLQDEGLRRVLVNGCYWALGLNVPAKTNVEYVGEFQPTMYGFKGFKKGVKPSDHELK